MKAKLACGSLMYSTPSRNALRAAALTLALRFSCLILHIPGGALSIDISIYRDISNCMPGRSEPAGLPTAVSTQASNICQAPGGESGGAYIISCVGARVLQTSFNKSDCSDEGEVSLSMPGNLCTHHPNGNTSSYYDCSYAGPHLGGKISKYAFSIFMLCTIILVGCFTDRVDGIEVHTYRNTECTGVMTVRDTVPSNYCLQVLPPRKNGARGEIFECSEGRVWITEYGDEDCANPLEDQSEFSIEADRCTAFGCEDSSDEKTCNTRSAEKHNWKSGTSVIYDCSGAKSLEALQVKLIALVAAAVFLLLNSNIL